MPATDSSARPVTLFYSYAHEDEPLRNELQDHLAILERRRVIQSWHDRAIVPGHDWSREIDERLRAADLVLLLVSKDFLASDYIMGVELDVAMQRQRAGEALVVPILLRQVDLQPEDAVDMPFVGLLQTQGLPRDLKPVTSWTNRDEAWTNVAGGLCATVNEIRARRPQLESVPLSAAARGQTSGTSALLDRVVGEFTERVVDANAAKGGPALDAHEVGAQARRLIAIPDAKRVLWVDDHPENNRYEIAALAKLQIDVTAVPSTDEGIACLEASQEGNAIDLVISDWTRSEDGPLAGLQLLAQMRRKDFAQPVVFYHGTFGAARSALALGARAAGAFGEAVVPADLIRLVLTALDR